MARKPSTLPRKTPAQQRSRATVEVLLDATARVLVRDGFDHASTNRIAECAGVSIGSLYQYFPNKAALVAALVARHNREMLELLRRSMEAVAALDIASAMPELIRAMVEAHQVDPELHRIFDEQVPRMGQPGEIPGIEREILALVRAYLERCRGEITVPHLDMATFVCVTTIEALTHEFVIRGPGGRPGGREQFVAEVARLVVGYLRSPVPVAPPPGGQDAPGIG